MGQTVRTGHGTTDWFQIGKGIHQGCILSPCLFNLYAEWEWKWSWSVWLFGTPWTAAHQASLSITNSCSLLKLKSIKLVMPSNHFLLCCPSLLLPQSFPASGSFPVSQLFPSGDQRIGASASASVLLMNIQGWFPLGLTGLISLQSEGLSKIQYYNSKASVALSQTGICWCRMNFVGLASV